MTKVTHPKNKPPRLPGNTGYLAQEKYTTLPVASMEVLIVDAIQIPPMERTAKFAVGLGTKQKQILRPRKTRRERNTGSPVQERRTLRIVAIMEKQSEVIIPPSLRGITAKNAEARDSNIILY